MEKAKYPSPYVRVTQKDHVGTHADSWAIDEAGSDGGIDYLIAPFTAIVKKIYTKDANEVWLESKDKVQFADGTQDYMTIMFAHDNNVSNLYVGKTIKQGERFYEEGTKGKASGNHCHFECAKGKFNGSGWHKNNAGYWSINNGKKVSECLFIDDSYHILNTNGYNFINVKNFNSNVGAGKNYINLKPTVDTWRIYDLNKTPKRGNEKGMLKPSKFGGLTYYIYAYHDNGTTAEIKTTSFGRGKIYIKDPNCRVTIDNPLYKHGEY